MTNLEFGHLYGYKTNSYILIEEKRPNWNCKGYPKFQNWIYQANSNFFEFESISGIEGVAGKIVNLSHLIGKVGPNQS